MIGHNGYEALKRHKFFEGLNFESLFLEEGPRLVQHLESRIPFNGSEISSQGFFFINEEFQNIIPPLSPKPKSIVSQEKSSDEKDSRSFDQKITKSVDPSELDRKPIFSGAVKHTVYMFFARHLKMVLYFNGQVILFRQGIAIVPFYRLLSHSNDCDVGL